MNNPGMANIESLGELCRRLALQQEAEKLAQEQAQEAYFFRHLTGCAQGQGFGSLVSALNELDRLRTLSTAILALTTETPNYDVLLCKDAYNRGWNDCRSAAARLAEPQVES